MTRPIAFLLLAAALGACGEPPPQVPTVLLARPSDTLATRYSVVSDAHWLGGRRWAVMAPDDAAVAIAAFDSARITPLAAPRGAAFQNPHALFGTGEPLFASDWGLRRITSWSADGRLLDTIPLPDALLGAMPEARDAVGRLYADVFPPPGRNGQGNRDSAVVLRARPGSPLADTVARLSPLDLAEVTGDAGRRLERRVFSGTDQWGVLADGTVWVARVNPNQVVWIDPRGEQVTGPRLPDRVLEVTRTDRQIFVEQFPPELRNAAQQLPYAPIKPPFEAAFTGGEELVWLEKSRALSDTVRRYQVIDRRGRLLREVHLPGPGRILATSPTEALVVERGDSGIRVMVVGLQ